MGGWISPRYQPANFVFPDGRLVSFWQYRRRCDVCATSRYVHLTVPGEVPAWPCCSNVFEPWGRIEQGKWWKVSVFLSKCFYLFLWFFFFFFTKYFKILEVLYTKTFCFFEIKLRRLYEFCRLRNNRYTFRVFVSNIVAMRYKINGFFF